MNLKASNGHSFQLDIIGYEFPELETESYDSNWLMIRVIVSHPNGNWTATHPSLLTYEVARLANWLDEIQSGTVAQSNCDFMEPNLEFKLIDGSSDSKTLRICFQLEIRPDWAKSKVLDDCNVWVEFPLAEIDLQKTAEELRGQLSIFPQRTER